MTVTELAIKRPTLIAVIFAALTVLGVYSYMLLNYELLPKMTPPYVSIAVVYPGTSPQEMETQVSKVIEDGVASLDKVKAITSNSYEGMSIVFIEFAQSASVDVVLQDVQRKVNEILPQLPEDAKTPVISKFALDEIPIIRMGVTGNMATRDFYQFVKDKIQPRLAKLEGVGRITLVGGEEREIKVNLNSDKINFYGLSLFQVTQAINAANMDFPTGKLENSKEQYIVRIAGKFNSVDALRNLIIGKSKTGGELRLSDIAEIEDGSKDVQNFSRINGVTSIGIQIQKQGDANAVEVSKLVRAEIASLENENKEANLKFDVAQDGSIFTINAANAVKEDLLIAVILVAIVMLLFLHSFRNSFIVILAIPASMISTFIAMNMFGFTLNLMTLLGLSLIVGILVDDSIVVLENIHHHLEMGEDQRTAALKGRNEIGFAALAITLVDVVVFLPLAFTGGIIGNIIRQFSLVVVVSTLLSLFVSFTVTPLLASRISKLERFTNKTIIGRFSLWFESKFKTFTSKYLNVLNWSILNPWKVIVFTVVLFFTSLVLIPGGFIGSEFIPQSDRGEFSVMLELPLGSSIERTNYVTQEVEKIISSIPEVKKISVNVGASNEGFMGFSSSHIAELSVALIPKNERTRSTQLISSEIKEKTLQIPGLKVRVNPIGIFGQADEAPIQMFVYGNERDSVDKAANMIKDILASIPGTADIRKSSEEGKPETKVNIDREKMAAFGLTLAEVGGALRIALTGDDNSKFNAGNNEYNIKISLDQFDRERIADLQKLIFVNNKGEKIELQQFATIVNSVGPTSLMRKDKMNSVIVQSQAVGRPSGSIGEELKEKINKANFPKGIQISYEGDLRMQSDSFGSLGLALIAAILFVYMIMVALYNSFLYPFVVLFSIPVAMVGALLALALSMKTISIFSILGIIMLIGLVGKNAILLVDRTNQKKEEGLSSFDALIEAGRSRLRPIVMTTSTMVAGMLPIALSQSSGSEWKTGLAWALIGGLTSSMFLTLVLVPAMYIKLEQWKAKLSGFFFKKKSGIDNQTNVEPA